MRTAQLKPSTRTLRFRLMVWNAFVVIITGVVILLGLREGVRIMLIHELDQHLYEDLSEIQLSLAEFGDPQSEQLREQLDRKAQGHSRHKWFTQLLDERGRVLCASANAPSPIPFAAARIGAVPQTIDGWRVLRQISSSQSKTLLLVGSSLERIHRDVALLDRLVAIAIGVILLIAPPCGYWLAGRATRPLAEIISMMAQVRPANLDERLPLRGTGDELDQLSVTFNRLLDRIGAYVQENRDFLANAAHELRTPLAAIRSSVEVALAGDRQREEYEELLGEIIEESSSLELLVNQLLLLAETEAERLKIQKERVRLDELVEKAMDMFGGVAEFRDIELSCPGLPAVEVEGNRQHLRQVIYNLLDNAIKFTAAGGRVRVDLKIDQPAGKVVFRVEDTGVGMSADDLPHVFDRFFCGDKARHRAGELRGTGLGLSICLAIVRAHEGTITVDSLPGKGTTFIVRLPLHPLEVIQTFADGQYKDHCNGHSNTARELVPRSARDAPPG